MMSGVDCKLRNYILFIIYWFFPGRLLLPLPFVLLFSTELCSQTVQIYTDNIFYILVNTTIFPAGRVYCLERQVSAHACHFQVGFLAKIIKNVSPNLCYFLKKNSSFNSMLQPSFEVRYWNRKVKIWCAHAPHHEGIWGISRCIPMHRGLWRSVATFKVQKF
jgi:hypothetical protein